MSGVNYETMYPKLANLITDKNTIISVLKKENQMMNDAFQAEIKQQIIQLEDQLETRELEMECFQQKMTRQMNECIRRQKMLEYTRQLVKREIKLDQDARLVEATWDKCGTTIKLSGEGLVATVTEYSPDRLSRLVTGGESMTEGRHYWEVEITKEPSGNCVFFVGAVRPGLDHNKCHCYTNDAYFIQTHDGSLCGNGRTRTDPHEPFAVGDRIGVWLDLDVGWLRFYRNGKRCGSGFTEGVTGPLVRGAEMFRKGNVLTVLPTAVAPLE